MANLTIIKRDDKVICPIQSEIENLAIKTLDTHENIFFDPIPLSSKFDLMWSNEYKGWILRYLLTS